MSRAGSSGRVSVAIAVPLTSTSNVRGCSSEPRHVVTSDTVARAIDLQRIAERRRLRFASGAALEPRAPVVVEALPVVGLLGGLAVGVDDVDRRLLDAAARIGVGRCASRVRRPFIRREHLPIDRVARRAGAEEGDEPHVVRLPQTRRDERQRRVRGRDVREHAGGVRDKGRNVHLRQLRQRGRRRVVARGVREPGAPEVAGEEDRPVEHRNRRRVAGQRLGAQVHGEAGDDLVAGAPFAIDRDVRPGRARDRNRRPVHGNRGVGAGPSRIPHVDGHARRLIRGHGEADLVVVWKSRVLLDREVRSRQVTTDGMKRFTQTARSSWK